MSNSGPRPDSIRADFDPKFDKVHASVDWKLRDGLKLKTRQQTGHSGTALVSAELDGKKWKVGYDLSKKMGYAAYEHQFEGFEIKVKQKLPDMNWSMIPSPELQLETKLIEKQNVSDKLELKYDCQSRVASVEEKLKFGKQHEMVLSANSVGGWSDTMVAWKTKPSRNYAKSVGVKYSKRKGPVLSYEVDPSDKVGLKLTTELESKVLKGEITYKPEKVEKGELGINFERHFHSATKPSVGLFVKYKFD